MRKFVFGIIALALVAGFAQATHRQFFRQAVVVQPVYSQAVVGGHCNYSGFQRFASANGTYGSQAIVGGYSQAVVVPHVQRQVIVQRVVTPRVRVVRQRQFFVGRQRRPQRIVIRRAGFFSGRRAAIVIGR